MYVTAYRAQIRGKLGNARQHMGRRRGHTHSDHGQAGTLFHARRRVSLLIPTTRPVQLKRNPAVTASINTISRAGLLRSSSGKSKSCSPLTHHRLARMRESVTERIQPVAESTWIQVRPRSLRTIRRVVLGRGSERI